MTPHRAAAAAALAFAFTAAIPAAAQGGEGRIVTVGAGVQIVPKFPGADDRGFSPLPVFDLRRPGDPIRFEASDQSFGLKLFGERGGFTFGPVLNLQSKREQDDVGAPVGDVSLTFEPGLYVQLWAGESVRMRAEVRRGINGHEGWVGDVGADVVIRDGDRTIFGIGPRLRWSDENYQNAYFGVSPAAAAASALPAYSADGGIHAAGAVAGVTHQFSPSWGVYGYAGYDRLVGDAADSPIVRQLGSRDQFSAGVALTYTFSVD